MIRTLLSVLCFVPACALAATTSIVIPEQEWQITFDAPVLAKQAESQRPGQYKYHGNAQRFNLSLFVETPGCGGEASHEALLACFWPQASKNPLIVQATVKKTCDTAFCKIEYEIQVPWQGRLLKQRNINFLIAYNGKWTDLHVSVIEPTEADLAMLENFTKSLTYGKGQ
jgi:hypothetical protein